VNQRVSLHVAGGSGALAGVQQIRQELRWNFLFSELADGTVAAE
jgi:hypothetical protein